MCFFFYFKPQDSDTEAHSSMNQTAMGMQEGAQPDDDPQDTGVLTGVCSVYYMDKCYSWHNLFKIPWLNINVFKYLYNYN